MGTSFPETDKVTPDARGHVGQDKFWVTLALGSAEVRDRIEHPFCGMANLAGGPK